MKDAVATSVPVLGARPKDADVDMFGITHTGHVRAENQDHFLLATVHPYIVVHGSSLPDVQSLPLLGERLATVLLVADGVGGGDDGGAAARLATEGVMRYVASTLRCYHAVGDKDTEFDASLRAAAVAAHATVRTEAAMREDPASRLATTLTMGVVVYPWCYVVQVGDSRAYIHSGGRLRQITRDQTLAQQLVDDGAMSPQDLARSPLSNVLSSAIGGDEATPVVSRVSVAERGCTLVFCTDGLTRHVQDEEIAAVCRDIRSSEQGARDLLGLALDRGAVDNVTIVVARAPLRH